jgi:hypothetical protein
VSHRYRFILPVWGEKFVERFLRFALPSQLAPGNLPALPADRCTYHVFTPTKDARRMCAAPSFQRLQRLVPTVLEPIDDVYLGYAYAAMTECHNRGLARGCNQDCAFVFVTPDSLWSDGSFRHFHELTESGKRAILLACTRINAEEALAELASKPADPGLRLTGRQVVALTIKHLHHSFQAYQWTENGNRGPGHFRFAVGRDGILVRATHLHPVVIRPVDTRARLTTNLDGDFVRNSCPSFAQVHLITDSDDACAVEFSDAAYQDGCYSKQPIPLADHVAFLKQNTDEHHRGYLRRQIRLHTRDITSEWENVETESDRVVELVLRAFAEHGGLTPGPATTAKKKPRQQTLARLFSALGQVNLDRVFGALRLARVDPHQIRPDGENAYVVDLAGLGIFAQSDREFHVSGATIVSRLVMLEDGAPLGPPHQIHDVIRSKGLGRYSHWGNGLHFSSSDNSDPRVNGRVYTIIAPRTLAGTLRRGRWKLMNRIQAA